MWELDIYPLFLGDVQPVPLLEERDTGLFNQHLQRIPVQRLEAFELVLALKSARVSANHRDSEGRAV